MLKTAYDPNKYCIDDVYKKMRAVCPEIVDSVLGMIDGSVADYAQQLWSDVPICQANISDNARNHLHNQLKIELNEQLGSALAQDALKSFIRKPILQTGPHCQLLFDKCNLFSAIFSLMGIKGVSSKFYFLSNCATTTMELRPKVGPCWLNYYDTNINLFNLSRVKRKSTSTYCLNEDLTFVMKPDFGEVNTDEVKRFYEKYKPLIDTKHFCSATSAFNYTNRVLWKFWDNEENFNPVFLDEAVYSKLLISHLKDKNSFIYKIFNNFSLQSKIITQIKIETDQPWGSMIPTQTDFLWYLGDNKIKPLKFTHDSIEILEEGISYTINNDIESIIDALENNRVIPNIFVIIAMVSLLPNSRLVGGLHQAAYYPALQRALISILDEHIEDENILKKYLSTNYNNAWGTHVLEEPGEILDILNEASDGFQIPYMINKYSNFSLSYCINDFEQFRRYYRWGQFLCEQI